jgi:hypothetical protein
MGGRGMAQVVEYLSSKLKALSPKLSKKLLKSFQIQTSKIITTNIT